MAADKEQILIIEDEEDLVELLRYNLIRNGFSVATAARGDEGLQAVSEKRPDLILLDLTLPGLSGLEVCQQLKRDLRTTDIPVVMVTARGEEADVVAGLAVGANDYLTKPFSMKTLISHIDMALRRQRSHA